MEGKYIRRNKDYWGILLEEEEGFSIQREKSKLGSLEFCCNVSYEYIYLGYDGGIFFRLLIREYFGLYWFYYLCFY